MTAANFRLTTAALLMLASLPTLAQSKDIVVDPKGEVPYAIDQRNVVVKSGSDLCWRTGYWTPGAAGEAKAGEVPVACECDKDVVGANKCAPAAAPVAAPAAAAPVVAAAPAPKKCDFSMTLHTDHTFAFNKAVLGPIAKKNLDDMISTKLAACAEVKSVIITGHTDRLGSQSYNQKLSEKRAEAVQSYLIAKGIKADLIDTMGAGKTQPVQSCDDKLGRKKLIECLAPNRRVTLDIKGPAK
ncbi:OmpA family protein [Zoogloea sp.]|jgi:OOP family OmpA-OmpF porin|uniref:OmpA family protein n=1 Tax=Zoogloea sp. TaxID=49181 RepID=UPI001B47F1F3|nr:OmpA family protein [Zoogloea sp.]MBK6652625.1 OmpA family protein [Zoogloea sp.]MBP7443740.1 OmpA family protein [Zoogloea sp.]HOY00110.1 OmpA family protein [Zoogloea sp.]HPI59495.1 OmpA family protein [Zoogloea sp.]